MKKIFAFSALLLTLNACQTSNLRGSAHVGFTQYAKAPGHKAFFVYESIDGGFVYAYSKARGTRIDAYNRAKKHCNSLFEKVNFTAKCNPYAIDDIKVSSLSQENINKLLLENATPKSSQSGEIQIKGTWEGVSTTIAGTLRPNYNGRRQMVLLADDKSCSGEGKYVRGKFASDTMPQGTWTINCNNGDSAGGTYEYQNKKTGTAVGIDNKGRKLNLTFHITPP
ncbi:hypothetical protein [Terasakiella sp. SH-1]|uniref:hypothetical protein n=1 Tax=Terasakiella sp. SH-1 TaxID=2560057 RepID=UPI0010747D04|nr:hypothetical protein [Terasakiella sp. SH-1]